MHCNHLYLQMGNKRKSNIKCVSKPTSASASAP